MTEFDTYYPSTSMMPPACTGSRFGLLSRCMESTVLSTPCTRTLSQRDGLLSDVTRPPVRPQNGSSGKQPKILFNLLMRESQMGCETPPLGSGGDAGGYYCSGSQYGPSALSDMYHMCATSDFLIPSTSYRPRSKSMGNAGWRLQEVASASTISRTPSRESLASYDESVASDEGMTRWSFGSVRSDLEDARSRLLRLSTKTDNNHGSPTYNNDQSDMDSRSLSQPGSPPSIPTYRKYSDCSQQMRLRRQGYRTVMPTSAVSSAVAVSLMDNSSPVDLSVRKKKFECTSGLPYSRRTPMSPAPPPPPPPMARHTTSSASLDEGIDNDDASSECSILKSILTGRVRSNSMSVVYGRRPSFGGGMVGSLIGGGGSSADFDLGRQMMRRRVTLAKKNLLPVMARVSDLLTKIADFVRTLPCFKELPVGDQRTLLSNACPRLLLLEMARLNVEFAVTAVHQTGNRLAEETEVGANDNASLSGSGGISVAGNDAEVPTQQFVENVRSFIHKCQMFGISSEEFLFMRMITLFQLGAGTLDRADLADAVNTEARQRLQEAVHRSHPSEKLRYSTLLLTLHTLFGIHCGMLQALLYRASPKAASIDEFVWNVVTGGSGTALATAC